ncbi:hypothetical protein GF325_06025, partial [Candidatus Bathyarchaeota archaeon]|nr:hypothetical protein [Candidatus Bathyarchaeota archaeon]
PYIISMDESMMRAGIAGEPNPLTEIPVLIGYPRYVSIMTDVGGSRDPGEPPLKPSKPRRSRELTVRTKFVDTAFWEPNLLAPGGKASFDIELPGSITTQHLMLVGTTEQCEIGHKTMDVNVLQEFFIQPDLPARLVQADVVEIGASIINRTQVDKTVNLSMQATGLSVMTAPSSGIRVAAGSRKRATWKVSAMRVGMASLRFTAETESHADTAIKEIYIHPKGKPEARHHRGMIDAGRKVINFDVNRDGEEAHYAYITLVPDILHGALDGLESMLGYPHGCVEQTLSFFLPNLLVKRHLEASHRLSASLLDTISDFTVKGIVRFMNFKHHDGGWGWWESDPTSTFMTAQVVQALALASSQGYHGQPGVMDQAISLLMDRQLEDGSWKVEKGFRWDRVPGIKEMTPCIMTASITSALVRSGAMKRHEDPIKDAIEFIKTRTDTIRNDANGVARTCLLLQETDPDSILIPRLVERLLELRQGNTWEGGSALGGTMESTALAMRVLHRHDRERYGVIINEAIKEILDNRSTKGGWNTTSDTVAVIETFLELDDGSTPECSIECALNDFSKKISIDEENLEESIVNMRNISLNNHMVDGRNHLVLDVVEGKKIHYQLTELIWTTDGTAKVEQEFNVKRQHSCTASKVGDAVDVTVRVESLAGIVPFVVIEETIPAGFILEKNSTIEKIGETNMFDHHQVNQHRLLLYPKAFESLTFSYRMIAVREFLGFHPGTTVECMYAPSKGCTAPVDELKVER